MIEQVRYALIPPYKCWVCGEKGDQGTNRDYFISTGVDTYDEGRVFICNVCFMDMVRVSPEAMTKAESDELLDIQGRAVANAMAIRRRWDELIQYSKEQGLDLEKFLDGRSINTDHSVPDATKSGSGGEVGTSSGYHSEFEPENEFKLTLNRG